VALVGKVILQSRRELLTIEVGDLLTTSPTS
jgi:hypothetical protein